MKHNIIKEFFESFLQIYEEGLEEEMSGSYVVFESVHLLYYDLDKTTLTRGESYIESPKYLINKGATINPKMKKMINAFSMH